MSEFCMARVPDRRPPGASHRFRCSLLDTRWNRRPICAVDRRWPVVNVRWSRPRSGLALTTGRRQMPSSARRRSGAIGDARHWTRWD